MNSLSYHKYTFGILGILFLIIYLLLEREREEGGGRQREREGEREERIQILIYFSTYLCSHWLLLVCALTGG